jgi:hypothetical protein
MGSYHGRQLQEFEGFAELSGFLTTHGRCSSPMGTFEEFERQLSRRMRKLESQIAEQQLARYDVDADRVAVGGVEYRRCLTQEPKTYRSASGPVTVRRNLYRPKGGGKSICPLELRAGIAGGFFTPVLASQVLYLMGLMTSCDAEKLFEVMEIPGPSSSSCDRMPKVFNNAWEEHREEWEEALRCQESVPAEATVMAVSLDGVMIPDKDAQAEAKRQRAEAEKSKKPGKQKTGPAGFKEVGCGTVTLYDDDGDRLETTCYGRAPEYKKKTLTEQLDAEVASVLAARPDLLLVALADGAEENWRYFDLPAWAGAIKIVDFWHACEHIQAGLQTYYGAKSVSGRAEFGRLRVLLRDKENGVEAVLKSLNSIYRKLRSKTRRKELLKEIKYFKNQRERMNYAEYQKLGLPIGSGVVEAACKTLAVQRMKRSGMSWRDGKQGILSIRSLQQSHRWWRGWNLVASSFRKDVLAA